MKPPADTVPALHVVLDPELPATSSQLCARFETIIAQQDSPSRSLILTYLKRFLEQSHKAIQSHFEQGLMNGYETARLIANLHDLILTALYEYTIAHITHIANPIPAEKVAICAVGGYGRREMAPGSDIDLLFLVGDKNSSAYSENVTEYILYMLWDLGLKVGHAVRSTEQCLNLCRDDQTILTAMLDRRLLCGDEQVFNHLTQKFNRQPFKRRIRAFIKAKLDERENRHNQEGNSRYIIEPNIKKGKGGLRDLHALYWIVHFLDRTGTVTNPQLGQAYIDMDLFSQSEARRFANAADFLWRTRIHLHYNAPHPTETLSFDMQPVIARKMGYANGPDEFVVEKFMREYFFNAREVGALTHIATTKLDARHKLHLPRGAVRFLPPLYRNMKEPGFVIESGRLNFADPLTIRHSPALILKLFEIAGRHNLNIHPDAFAAINFRRNLIDNQFRSDPHIAEIFKNILLHSQGLFATLKLMNEADVLGRYLLEFGGIVARTQFNMYHAYTVDEHTLRLLDYYKDLELGALEKDHPDLTAIVQAFDEDQRLSLYMACLLHDTGKGHGDQCIEGARLARRACNRIGMSKAQTERVTWLVRSHLEMNETAQRRDISDPDTITIFARHVGSLRRLNMLYALTVVDIRAVGPNIWNDWKGSLLSQLYQLTANVLKNRSDLEPLAKSTTIKTQLMDRLADNLGARITPIIDALPNHYWTSFNMIDLIHHARFFNRAIKSQTDYTIHIRINKTRDITELWFLGQDRPGLFTDLTLAIGACNANIVGARIHTGQTPPNLTRALVMNVFYLHDTRQRAFGLKNTSLFKKLSEHIYLAAQGQTQDIHLPIQRSNRRQDAIPVQPKVRFIDLKNTSTFILEFETRDQESILLHNISKCLNQTDLNILSAHIENIGIRILNAFYVRPLSGQAFTLKQRQALQANLLALSNNSEAQDKQHNSSGQYPCN